eukprot:6399-Heterococcus_DN1.PRE.4
MLIIAHLTTTCTHTKCTLLYAQGCSILKTLLCQSSNSDCFTKNNALRFFTAKAQTKLTNYDTDIERSHAGNTLCSSSCHYNKRCTAKPKLVHATSLTCG